MDKNTFIDLATNSSLADVLNILRTTKILGLNDQDCLLETLEVMEEEAEHDDPIYLLHSPYGDLEAHFYIPNSDAVDLLDEGCEIIKVRINMDNSSNNPNHTEDNMTNEQLIKDLFDAYVSEGGAPRITSFRTHLNSLLSNHIRPLTGGSSGKTGDGSSWRADQKARFSGRGMKWVFVSTESVTTSLDEFDKKGIDTLEYRAWIQQEGRAWVRYSGPRLLNGKPAAAFEVRTLGSTVDQPKELHLILDDELDTEIEMIRTTPYARNLEELVTAAEEETEEVNETEEVESVEESDLDDFVSETELDDDDLEDDDDL